jgi:RNA polymerase sigma-70 factor (ECF subfamily)
VLLFAALASRLGDGAGDGAFRAVFDEHVPYAARFLRRLGVGPGELDDVLQEVFLVVYRRFQEIEAASLRPWIHGVCARKASEHRRSSRRRRDAPVAEGETPEIADTSAQGRDPERRAAESQELARLDRVLDDLTDDERVAFVLYEIEGLTLKEIAEATSAPVSSVHARLDRARDRVTRAFSRPPSRRSA